MTATMTAAERLAKARELATAAGLTRDTVGSWWDRAGHIRVYAVGGRVWAQPGGGNLVPCADEVVALALACTRVVLP